MKSQNFLIQRLEARANLSVAMLMALTFTAAMTIVTPQTLNAAADCKENCGPSSNSGPKPPPKASNQSAYDAAMENKEKLQMSGQITSQTASAMSTLGTGLMIGAQAADAEAAAQDSAAAAALSNQFTAGAAPGLKAKAEEARARAKALRISAYTAMAASAALTISSGTLNAVAANICSEAQKLKDKTNCTQQFDTQVTDPPHRDANGKCLLASPEACKVADGIPINKPNSTGPAGGKIVDKGKTIDPKEITPQTFADLGSKEPQKDFEKFQQAKADLLSNSERIINDELDNMNSRGGGSYADGGSKKESTATSVSGGGVRAKQVVSARTPASRGLAKSYKGSQIGVAGDDLFMMMNRRYQLKVNQDTFLNQ